VKGVAGAGDGETRQPRELGTGSSAMALKTTATTKAGAMDARKGRRA
jgi:hypothetical protein